MKSSWSGTLVLQSEAAFPFKWQTRSQKILVECDSFTRQMRMFENLRFNTRCLCFSL